MTVCPGTFGAALRRVLKPGHCQHRISVKFACGHTRQHDGPGMAGVLVRPSISAQTRWCVWDRGCQENRAHGGPVVLPIGIPGRSILALRVDWLQMDLRSVRSL